MGKGAKVGVTYTLFIPGEPYPKSTKPPPRARSKSAREWVIQNVDGYEPLKKTMNYQRMVADYIRYMPEIPVFDKDDPITIGFVFYKQLHARGDRKNLEAAVEDGLTHSGKIHDDMQIVGCMRSTIEYYSAEPGVMLSLRIDDRVLNDDRLFDWLSRSKGRMERYKKLRELE